MALRNDSNLMSLGNLDLDQRVWEIPDENAWNGDPFDILGISSAFDRTEMANDYPSFLTPPFGSVGDTAACKLQSDLLGAQERAYRMREASPIRCVMHAAVRRNGHSNPGVGNFARIDAYLQDMIVAGSTQFEPQ